MKILLSGFFILLLNQTGILLHSDEIDFEEQIISVQGSSIIFNVSLELEIRSVVNKDHNAELFLISPKKCEDESKLMVSVPDISRLSDSSFNSWASNQLVIADKKFERDNSELSQFRTLTVGDFSGISVIYEDNDEFAELFFLSRGTVFVKAEYVGFKDAKWMYSVLGSLRAVDK